jgi:eukaryotic-like serine/threonine-protein kinase
MPGAEHFVEAIVREAGGSPFFVEQLTRYALTSERAATTGISLAEMLDAGLSQLSAGARELLETLSVAGRPVDPDVVFDAAGLDGDAHALVTSLRAAHFLRSSGSAQHIELYHDRIRETFTSLLDPARVRGIHASLAKTLESRGVEDPEALFEHYLGAGERKLAAGQAFLAAKRADKALAFDRAALFYRKALQLGPVKGTNIMELKGSLGNALANAGRSAEAAEAYLDAALDADSERGLDFQTRAAAQLLMGGHIDEGLDVIRTLLEAVGLKLAPGPKRALLSLILRRAHLKLRGINFKERPEELVPRDDLRRIDICWSVAAGLGMVDNIRAADFQTRGLLLALEAGEPRRIARALAFEAAFTASPGGPDNTRPAKFQKAAEALARKVDDPHATGLVTFTEGMAAYLVGEWKKAARLCDEASEILRDRCTGAVWELSSAQRITLSAFMLMGRLGEISRRLPGLLAAAKEQGNLYAATDLRTRLNIMWLAADDPDGAREEVIEALLEWSQGGFHVQHYNSLQAMTQIELYTGDGLVAWKHITGQWETIRKSMLVRIQILRVEALYLQGRAALAAAREQKDDYFLKRAEHFAQRLERERMHWTRPLAALLRAGACDLRGDLGKASTFLSQAAEGFDAADMKLYAAAARRHLGRILGGDEGGEMVLESDRWMRSQMIRNPARMTRMLAPGFATDLE